MQNLLWKNKEFLAWWAAFHNCVESSVSLHNLNFFLISKILSLFFFFQEAEMHKVLKTLLSISCWHWVTNILQVFCFFFPNSHGLETSGWIFMSELWKRKGFRLKKRIIVFSKISHGRSLKSDFFCAKYPHHQCKLLPY